MPSLDQLFAYAVAILAGAAVLGALVVVIVAEAYTIRRTINRHRKPDPYEEFWRSQRALAGPK
jgi:hypothetical protein